MQFFVQFGITEILKQQLVQLLRLKNTGMVF